MKNKLKESPKTYKELHGRCRFCCDFVDKDDITGKNILNVGCGFGWFELFCLEYGPTSIMGVEPKEEDLQTAMSSVCDKRVAFKKASALNLPFADNSFDTVTLWDVIEHVPRNSEETVFKELHRVLKPDGIVYLSTPFKSFLATSCDPAFWLIGHRHYSKEKLDYFAEFAALTKICMVVKGRYAELLSIWNLYFSKWILNRHPLFGEWFDNRVDGEYATDKGFMTVFAKYTRTK